MQAAKEHLPKDIITILERLGKVDNTPFNKLYHLAESCVDRYYTNVIKTSVEIIKQSVTDYQVVLDQRSNTFYHCNPSQDKCGHYL